MTVLIAAHPVSTAAGGDLHLLVLELNLTSSLHTLLQILSVTLFEKLDLVEALTSSEREPSISLTNCICSTFNRTAMILDYRF